jgi:hypothetical protein
MDAICKLSAEAAALVDTQNDTSIENLGNRVYRFKNAVVRDLPNGVRSFLTPTTHLYEFAAGEWSASATPITLFQDQSGQGQ